MGSAWESMLVIKTTLEGEVKTSARLAKDLAAANKRIAELEAKIEELRHVTTDPNVNLQDEITRLQAKSRQLTTSIFSNLTPGTTLSAYVIAANDGGEAAPSPTVTGWKWPGANCTTCRRW